jgi:hypothetical protein
LNTHYWFAFVLIAYAAWLLVVDRFWSVRELGLLGIFTGVPFLVFDLALFLHQNRVPAASWTPRPSFWALRDAFVGNFGLVPADSRRAIVGAMLLGALIVWPVLARRCNWQRTYVRSALFFGFLYVVMIGLPFLVSLKKPIFWAGRYEAIAVPFFALFAASVLLCLPVKRRILFQLLLAGLCVIYFARAVQNSKRTDELQTLDPVPFGDRAAARVICAESAPAISSFTRRLAAPR